MRLAIFSDIHGKILLPFKLADLYQQQTGRKIDFILQCGDIGAYPSMDNLDKATLKHAKQDRDELGFHDDFTHINPVIQTYLNKLNIDMICVRGNHEDHDYLDQLEKENGQLSRFPIDVYKRVFVCRSGVRQELRKDDEVLHLVGIGRIGDQKGRTDKRFIQEYEKKEIRKLLKTNQHFDILITHDKDDSNERGYGMAAIREVLDNVIFRYHFYGHTGEPFKQETDYNGITQSVKISELEYSHSGILPEGSMIILEKKGENDFQLEVVSQQFTNQLTRFNWKD
ncbi:metallophosphoesterase family protein [Chitinophaga flava]|uniref:Serine/threonine protein phosphatase n=1 Tax=Chitinophaga flava TaxID=2259036 RepID=A0A365XWD4_9BACT|nr:metallophosphoesterase [Chitinophaga flava]RBL90666.1 serine/threonine protein phosphatase [Chitinophaga flava]